MGRSLARTGTLQLLAGAVIISFSAIFVRLAEVGPTAAGFYRNLFGAAALLVVAGLRRETLWRGPAPALWAGLTGVLFALDLACWHRSIHFIGPGLATILGNFQVFFLAAVGILILREPPTWRLLTAVPLAVAGLLLLVGPEWPHLSDTYRSGVWLGLATAVAYTGYTLSLRRCLRPGAALGATATLVWVCLTTAALLGGGAVLEGASLRIPSLSSLAVLLAYGVVCQCLGWIVISAGIARVPASRVGLLLLLQPTLTFVWDMAFFARPTTWLEGSGALLALTAIYLGGSGDPEEGRVGCGRRAPASG